jgi:hypothetical protein
MYAILILIHSQRISSLFLRVASCALRLALEGSVLPPHPTITPFEWPELCRVARDSREMIL